MKWLPGLLRHFLPDSIAGVLKLPNFGSNFEGFPLFHDFMVLWLGWYHITTPVLFSWSPEVFGEHCARGSARCQHPTRNALSILYSFVSRSTAVGFWGAKGAWVDGEDLMGLGYIFEIMYIVTWDYHEIDSFYVLLYETKTCVAQMLHVGDYSLQGGSESGYCRWVIYIK